MFHTISYKGGFVQLATYDGVTTIKAWSHGQFLGDKYSSIVGAKIAITRHHKAWVNDRNSDHYSILAQNRG